MARDFLEMLHEWINYLNTVKLYRAFNAISLLNKGFNSLHALRNTFMLA